MSVLVKSGAAQDFRESVNGLSKAAKDVFELVCRDPMQFWGIPEAAKWCGVTEAVFILAVNELTATDVALAKARTGDMLFVPLAILLADVRAKDTELPRAVQLGLGMWPGFLPESAAEHGVPENWIAAFAPFAEQWLGGRS